jgi:hypothetical protein
VTGHNDIRRKIIDFFVCLAVCHTVIPIHKKAGHADLHKDGATTAAASSGSVGDETCAKGKRASSSASSRVHPLDFVKGLASSSASSAEEDQSAGAIEYQVCVGRVCVGGEVCLCGILFRVRVFLVGRLTTRYLCDGCASSVAFALTLPTLSAPNTCTLSPFLCPCLPKTLWRWHLGGIS